MSKLLPLFPGRALFRIGVVWSHLRPRSAVMAAPTAAGPPDDVCRHQHTTTAGVIIIGDEILKGYTQDTNTYFICRKLHSLGVKVERVSVIGDDLPAIADEVSQFSKRYTYVLTAGGIGPTHDDLTFQGVANAFGEKLQPNPKLVELCQKYLGADANDLTSPRMKMALVPESAKLLFGYDNRSKKQSRFPIINVRNVYVFPGVPALMEKSLTMLEDVFSNKEVKFHFKQVFVSADETSIAPYLNTIDAKYRGKVQLGSYPDWLNNYYRVKLTLESESEDDLKEAHQDLLSVLTSDKVVDYVERDPVGMAAQEVYGLVEKDDGFSIKVKAALSIVEECLEKYEVPELCVSFNGGKDCTALLHLVHAAIAKKYPAGRPQLQVLYIQRPSPFPETEDFVRKTAERYDLKMYTLSGDYKEALLELQRTHPQIKAVLMGQRRGDPYVLRTNMAAFCMTDSGWPQYMRVNPMLEFTYHDVWKFMRSLYLPYCILYDRGGYSSLGNMINTKQNPYLRFVDEFGVTRYKPAYMLEDESGERDGRH